MIYKLYETKLTPSRYPAQKFWQPKNKRRRKRVPRIFGNATRPLDIFLVTRRDRNALLL